jgi:hypothetical protein
MTQAEMTTATTPLPQVSLGVAVREMTTPIGPDDSSEWRRNPHFGGNVSKTDRWESSMADVVAHLVSAHQLLGGLMELAVDPRKMGLPADMASHGICAALVSLDECSEIEWNAQVRLPSADAQWSQVGATWRNLLGDPSLM